MLARSLGLIAATLATFWFSSAAAHRQPEMVTVIEAPASETADQFLKITHRIHAHDALNLIPVWTDASAPDLDDQSVILAMGAKLADQLVLSLDQEFVGAELDGNFVFVYAMAPVNAEIVSAHGLSALDPAWVHRVDWRTGDSVLSHTFSERRGTKPSKHTMAP